MTDFTQVFENTMPIRWGDLDAFGHVNNTVYFRFVEQARMEWLTSSGRSLSTDAGPVVVATNMNFRKQLLYPGNVVCTMLAKAPGRSSVDTRFELRRDDDPNGEVIADGGAVVVWVDYAAGRSLPLPEDIRALLPVAPSA